MILVENRDFSYPLHSTPSFVGIAWEYCHPVWYEKTSVMGLPDGEKFLRICITVYPQYRRVRDRQTDVQTDILPWYSPRYAYVSRCKN